MATLILPNKKPKKIKNLGWLLKNWQKVERLGFLCHPFNNSEFSARLKDGGVYLTDFADFSIAFNFVNRPVFAGLEFRIREYEKDLNGKFYSFIIGSEKYKQINKINNSGRRKEFLELVFNPSNLSPLQQSI